jgi:DNA-binding CsgD family transcriptional regulator
MLSIVERFIGPIRRVASNEQGKLALGQIAGAFGFRSAFLLEYVQDFSGTRRLLDTNPARAAAWPELFRTRGFLIGVKGIQTMLDTDTVVELKPERFEPDHPYKDFAARFDLGRATAIPISLGQQITGLMSFSGEPSLSRQDKLGLQLLGYSLFAQLRQLGDSPAKMLSLPPLTPREKEVMGLSAIGLTSVEIADKLGMSPRTVNQHVDNVADKLGTRNRTHTIAELVRNDMLE